MPREEVPSKLLAAKLIAPATWSPDVVRERLLSVKLDIGCGIKKLPGFHGVDQHAFVGVDTVLDVRLTPWPWREESVSEIHSSHFLEHLTAPERVTFFNESYRVLAWDGTVRIVTPHWSHDCAYGDPTHQWPPLSPWVALYLQKTWRIRNAPHTDAEQTGGFGYACDFDWKTSGTRDQWLMDHPDKERMFWMQHGVNSTFEVVIELRKAKR
jgi:predicted SAM-dependent methyltransferase